VEAARLQLVCAVICCPHTLYYVYQVNLPWPICGEGAIKHQLTSQLLCTLEKFWFISNIVNIFNVSHSEFDEYGTCVQMEILLLSLIVLI